MMFTSPRSRYQIVKAAQTAEGIAATFAARSHDDDDEESEEDREAVRAALLHY